MMWDPTATVEALILSPPEPYDQAIPCSKCYGRGTSMSFSTDGVEDLKLRAAALAETARSKEVTSGGPVEQRCELTAKLQKASGAIPKTSFRKSAGRGQMLRKLVDAWDRLQDWDHGQGNTKNLSSGALGNKKDTSEGKAKPKSRELPSSSDHCTPAQRKPPVPTLKQGGAKQSPKREPLEMSRIKTTILNEALFSLNASRGLSAASPYETVENKTVSPLPPMTTQHVVGNGPSNQANVDHDSARVKVTYAQIVQANRDHYVILDGLPPWCCDIMILNFLYELWLPVESVEIAFTPSLSPFASARIRLGKPVADDAIRRLNGLLMNGHPLLCYKF